MKQPASLLFFSPSQKGRDAFAHRLEQLSAQCVESADQLLALAGATRPVVVVLAPASEEETRGLTQLAADVRSRSPEASILFLTGHTGSLSDGDTVLDPYCPDGDLVRICRLLGQISGLRAELMEMATTLQSAKRHQETLAETHQQELQQLTEAALTDRLTGVANRRHLDLRLEEMFAEAKRQVRNLGVAVFDLDHFKSINEQFGHEAGDLTLSEFADALKSGLRHGDFVGRIGGDEFVVLLPYLGPLQLLGVGQRLLESVASRKVVYEGQTIALAASAGLSTYPDDGSRQASELLHHADLAMLDSKRQGRHCVRVWNSSPANGGATQSERDGSSTADEATA